MIQSVQFKNFKALRDTVLPVGRFTLIVGANGSGKSTAIQALRLADERRSPEGSIATAGVTVSEKEPVEMVADWAGPLCGVNEVIRFQPSRGRTLRRNGTSFHGQEEQVAQGWWARIRAYSLQADAIARPVVLRPKIELTERGEGLAGVLTDLRDRNEERFDGLCAEFWRWFPEYDAILFSTPADGARAFSLQTRTGHHEIPANDLSQGTLLALCMLTLAYLPDAPSMVCFEEPDRGLHPRLLRDVQGALYRLSHPESCGEDRKPIQVIATTHSPYFLDLFRDHPDEIVIARKIGTDATFERLVDQPNIEDILESAPLGEVCHSGILPTVTRTPWTGSRESAFAAAAQRGNQPADEKAAAGEFFNPATRILQIQNHGSHWEALFCSHIAAAVRPR